jgi:hypothetical protein
MKVRGEILQLQQCVELCSIVFVLMGPLGVIAALYWGEIERLWEIQGDQNVSVHLMIGDEKQCILTIPTQLMI